MSDENCVYCKVEITEELVIFVREKVDDKWDSHACCSKCWNEKNPNRIPHRVNLKAFEESEND